MNKTNSEYVNFVLELLRGLGAVSARRMFGGYGLYLHGLMFAIIVHDVLYFKVNVDTRADFTSKGLPAFTYQKQGKIQQINYYQCPDDALEDEELMQMWASKAYGVAIKARK